MVIMSDDAGPGEQHRTSTHEKNENQNHESAGILFLIFCISGRKNILPFSIAFLCRWFA